MNTAYRYDSIGEGGYAVEMEFGKMGVPVGEGWEILLRTFVHGAVSRGWKRINVKMMFPNHITGVIVFDQQTTTVRFFSG